MTTIAQAIFILYINGVVAAGSSGREYTDWVNRGEYSSQYKCESAGKELAPGRYKCLAK
jgi:hypothetical protein